MLLVLVVFVGFLQGYTCFLVVFAYTCFLLVFIGFIHVFCWFFKGFTGFRLVFCWFL